MLATARRRASIAGNNAERRPLAGMDALGGWRTVHAGGQNQDVAQVAAAFDLDEEYVYAIFSRDEKSVWGGTGLHKRLEGSALEIGYWIHADQINRGLATETSAALSRVAFEVHKVDRVEIHCATENVRSAAIPRKLGYEQEATLRRRAEGVNGSPHDVMIWTLFREAYSGSPMAHAPIRAFDATGNEIPLSQS